MHESLLTIISRQVSLSPADIGLCKQYFEPVSFPKNQIVEAQGKIPQYIYFVVAGFMRLFHYNEKGEEVTTHINCPPSGFITSYINFVNQTTSDNAVASITACDLLKISKKNLDFITKESAALQEFSIWVHQQSIAYHENRSKELTSLTGEQRYRKLLENNSEVLQHVPLQYIASFLGLKPESLSRIRRQITN